MDKAYEFAIRHRLWHLYEAYSVTISNKDPLPTHEYKIEPEYTKSGWYGGYSFKHFWSNCKALLGVAGMIDGMQQLCHHYYLQNGSLGAMITVSRIRKFVGI